jgi:hypothetical protein
MVATPTSATAWPNVDRVVDRGNGLERVQIKKVLLSPSKKGHVHLKCHHGRGHEMRYDIGAFDVLAAVDIENGDMWMIPSGELPRSRSIRVDAMGAYKCRMFGEGASFS